MTTLPVQQQTYLITERISQHDTFEEIIDFLAASDSVLAQYEKPTSTSRRQQGKSEKEGGKSKDDKSAAKS